MNSVQFEVSPIRVITRSDTVTPEDNEHTRVGEVESEANQPKVRGRVCIDTEICEPDVADGWSVYRRNEDGIADWVIDVPTQSEALTIAKRLAIQRPVVYRSPMAVVTVPCEYKGGLAIATGRTGDNGVFVRESDPALVTCYAVVVYSSPSEYRIISQSNSHSAITFTFETLLALLCTNTPC